AELCHPFFCAAPAFAAGHLRDAEAVCVIIMIGSSCLLIAKFLYLSGVYPSFQESIRYATFNVVSVGTSSGFMSADYAQWPLFASMWMLLLATVGSSAGSTGGGIKMIRSIILVRQAGHELLRLIHPRAVRTLIVWGQVVDQSVILSVIGCCGGSPPRRWSLRCSPPAWILSPQFRSSWRASIIWAPHWAPMVRLKTTRR
ncbi:MAG: potassium transporter TrkG, partial [Quisquiliibacterium sp.]